jgi:tetratricopeptide (TPR) repeat protein
LGAALLEADRPVEALANFEGALTLSPGQIDYLASQGAGLSALGRHSEAMASFEQVFALDGNYFEENDRFATYVRASREALARNGATNR